MNNKCYIFDLEGTLTDNRHRVHLAEDGKWDEYSELLVRDPPREDVVMIYRSLQAVGYHCAISTGLSAKYLGRAVSWLKNQAGITPDQLMMRPDGNFMHSPELKRGHLVTLRQRYDIVGVFEDRDKNIDMYQKEGVPCLIVAQRRNY